MFLCLLSPSSILFYLLAAVATILIRVVALYLQIEYVAFNKLIITLSGVLPEISFSKGCPTAKNGL